MKNFFTFANTALFLSFVCATVSMEATTTVTWNSTTTGGAWSTASNWNPATVPVLGDDVVFAPANSFAVTLSEDSTTASISTDGTGTITISGAYQLTPYTINVVGAPIILSGLSALYINLDLNIGGDSTVTLLNTPTANSGNVIIASGATLALSGTGSAASAGGVGADGTFNISATTTGSTVQSLFGSGIVTLGSKSLTISNGATFSGVIQGTGTVTKSGSASTQVLSGANTYTGATTISGGMLEVDGSITSNVTVDSGGTLSGSGGTITGNVTVDAGGAISPGSGTVGSSSATLSLVKSPGILKITGALTLDSGSYVTIPVTAPGFNVTDASELIVDGTASVSGGNLDITFANSTNYRAGAYTVFDANAMTGTFSSITTNYLDATYGITVTTAYSGPTVSFTITTDEPTLVVPVSGNAAKLFNHIKSHYTNPLLSPLFQKIAYQQTLDLGGQRLQEALNDVQPACGATATFASSEAQFNAFNVISSRSATWRFWNAMGQKKPDQKVAQLEQELFLHEGLLASNADQPFKKGALQSSSCVLNMGRPGDRYAVWFNPFGAITHGDTSMGAEVPYHTYTGGGMLGMDTCISNSGIIEGVLGAARTSVILSQDAGRQTVNYYFAGLNGTYTIDNFYIEAGLLASYDQLQNRRYINLPDYGATASSSHNMWQLTPQLGFGYLIWANSWGIEPFVTEDWAFNFEQKSKEHGAAILDTSVAARNSSLLRSEIGLNFYNDYTFTSGGVLLFRATGAYVNKVPFNVGSMSVSFYKVGIGAFEVDSFNKTQNLGTAGVEFVYGATNGIFGSIQYDGEFGKGYSANELQLQLGYSF